LYIGVGRSESGSRILRAGIGHVGTGDPTLDASMQIFWVESRTWAECYKTFYGRNLLIFLIS
jgi:hypothetical protein